MPKPPSPARLARPALAVALLVVGLGCSDTDVAPGGCATEGARCTLGEAGTEAGLFLGSTSEGSGWTNEPEGELLRTHFNSVTSQNELKWGALVRDRGEYRFAEADETVAFTEANGMRMRGHVLFWHRLNGPPAWLADELASANDPEAHLRALMREHVETVVGRYRGRIHTWDVVNEPLALLSDQIDHESIFFQTFADYDDFLDHAFRLARSADPDAQLFLNEILPAFSEVTFDGLYQIVRRLLERGTPIDGVGFQGHFVLGAPDREILRQRLQAFADLGLLVEITELDVTVHLFPDAADPLAAQADVYADVYAACAAVERCIGVTTWNPHDGTTWLDVDAIFGGQAPHFPTLFDANLEPKPAYHAAVEAVVGSRRASRWANPSSAR